MRHKTLNPEYELFTANSFDNSKHLPADFIDDLRKMETESPRKFNRFVMNSDEDYDLEGAYYAALMSDALKDGRVDVDTLYEPTARVYTIWDLGLRVSDTTAIWLAQDVKEEVWLIDYYENYGEGMQHYAVWLEQQKYIYGRDFLPPDGNQRLQGRIVETRFNILQGLRRNPVELVPPHLIASRIQLARDIIPRCRFSSKCERGVDCLNHYKKKKNEILSTEAKPVFAPEPLHDWASNGADAFGYMAVVKKYSKVTGGNIDDFATVTVADSVSNAPKPYRNKTGQGLRKLA